MDIAFIVDPLDSRKAYKDSSIAMMRASALRGHRSHAVEQTDLSWRGGPVVANGLPLADNTHWHDTETAENRRTIVTNARIIFRASQGNRT